MSFVGTQIIDITNQDPGLLIKPGLTGLVHRANPNFIQHENIRDYEQYYAMNYSLIYDLEIVLKCILRL